MVKYRPEVDGLRALAVLPVILFHAGAPGFQGGFVGVDVFFVISGYLISSILIRDTRSDAFSIVKFYERRARRILPALAIVIAACVPFSMAWMTPLELREFSQSILAVTAFLANVFFFREADYFAADSETFPLLHTWSLAVEEQFYFVFPWILIWAVRSRLNLRVALFSLTILGFISAELMVRANPAAAFFLLPARVWELAAGALVAANEDWQNEGTSVGSPSGRALAKVGVLLIVASIAFLNGDFRFPGMSAAPVVLGTMLVLMFANAGEPIGRLLSHKALVGIGLVSYSAYLWHQPLLAFARIRSPWDPSPTVLTALVLLTFGLAFVTWKYVEQPFRNKSLVPTRAIWISSAGFVLGSLLLGLVGHTTDGVAWRGVWADKASSIDQRLRPNPGMDHACDKDFTLDPRCRTTATPEILLWGDSHAMHLASAVARSVPEKGMVQMTKSACGPLLGVAPVLVERPLSWTAECIAFNDSVVSYAKRTPSLRYAVLSSSLHQYVGKNARITTRSGSFSSDHALARASLLETVDALQSLGILPILVSTTPRTGEDIGRCFRVQTLHDGSLRECDLARNEVTQYLIGEQELVAELSKRIPTIRLDSILCDTDTCRTTLGVRSLYRDAGHLSFEGSDTLGVLLPLRSFIFPTQASDSVRQPM